MQHKHITLFLSVLLAAVCIFMTVNLIMIYKESAYLPDETVDSIVSILAGDNIRIDPDIIPTKRENGTVYVCNSADYNRTVAQLLGNSVSKAEYAIPDGSLIVLENGAMVEFGGSFSFRYSAEGNSFGDVFSANDLTDVANGEIFTDVADTVVEFLDSGSREFDTSNIDIVTVVESVREKDGVYYVYCTRTLNGVAVTGNYAHCTVSGGHVTNAEGTWSFLTLGQSYSSQLSDLFNILFHVRKEIKSAARESLCTVTITAIDLCYSLYFYGEDEEFCLIPCWQIATDICGNYIYNALDSTLYTNNSH